MRDTVTNVPRLIWIATLLFAVLAGSLVYFAYRPQTLALQERLDDDTSTLRSDETVLHAMPRLRAEREKLARTYEPLFAQNAEAVFLRDLSAAAERHGVTLVSSSLSRGESEGTTESRSARFAQRRVEVVLRGPYAQLLATIGDVSAGSEVVRVDAPTLRRDDEEILATVPVAIFEPLRRSALPSPMPPLAAPMP